MKKVIFAIFLILLALIVFMYILPLVLFSIKMILGLIIIMLAIIGAIELLKKDKSNEQ